MAKKKISKSTNGREPKPANEDSQALQIDHVIPEGVSSKFSNHITIQFAGHEFHLSFFEIQPPIALGTPEERKKILSQLESIEAKCVARVIIAASRMPGVVQAMLENVRRNMPVEFLEIIKAFDVKEQEK